MGYGVLTFACLMPAAFGALTPLIGWVSATLVAFLMGLFLSPLLAYLYHNNGVEQAHVVASNILLVLLGLTVYLLGNPLGGWALLLYLVILTAPFAKRRRRGRAPGPGQQPRQPPRRPRRGRRQRERSTRSRGRRRGRQRGRRARRRA